MHDDTMPRRVGRNWIYPDGLVLPVVAGGDGEGDDDFVDEIAAEGNRIDDVPSDDGDTKPAVNHAKEAAKWKALARKHEQQAKANAEAAQKLQELEHSGKSETEKLQALLDEERAKARTASVEALKLRVAAEKELPASAVKFLPDLDDEVDMMQAADELVELLGTGPAATGGQPSRQPKSNLTDPLSNGDPNAERERLIAQMTGRFTT